MLSSVVQQFHLEIGETKGLITAKNEAKHVSKYCGKYDEILFVPFYNKCIATIVQDMYCFFFGIGTDSR